MDAAIQQFNPYLVQVAQSGACKHVKEARLLQLIADNSLLYTGAVACGALLFLIMPQPLVESLTLCVGILRAPLI